MSFFSWIRRVVRSRWIAIACVSVVAGAVAGWVAASAYFSPQELRETFERLWQERPAPTTTQERVTFVPLVSRPVLSVYPAEIAERRVSSVGTIVTGVTTRADGLANWQQEKGQAVAVTSDGWFVTVASTLPNSLAEARLLWNGGLFRIERAVRDTATDAAFIFVGARDVPVVTMARAVDAVAGLAVWIETSPRQLYPDVLMTTRAVRFPESISSERVERRFVVGAPTAVLMSGGGAVWDQEGRLMGLLESSRRGTWSVLPAQNIEHAIESLLRRGDIVRPFLGVHVVDIASLTFASVSTSLPSSGAWVRSEGRVPAIATNSPAQGLIREGDVLTHIERDILDGVADIGERLLEYRPGTEVHVRFLREGKQREGDVVLGAVTTSVWILK